MKDYLIDTHCHIHDSEYEFLQTEVLSAAQAVGVKAVICVGTDLRSSKEALDFCFQHDYCYASIGLHPHLAVQPLKDLKSEFSQLRQLAYQYKQSKRLVAIGECGLDYFYHHQPEIRQRQQTLFTYQIQLAQDLNLPLILHIRQAFSDFWKLYQAKPLPAVLHSFSDNREQVDKGLSYSNLYYGLNGIMTFSRDANQLEAARAIPLNKLLLETDAPYLTPIPFRGKLNKPQYLRYIYDFLIKLRPQDANDLAIATTSNAQQLFQLPDILVDK